MFDFTLIVLPSSYGSSVAATLDILRCAEELAPRVQAPVPRWRICSLNGKKTRLQSGLLIETTPLRMSDHDTSTWILPGLGLTSTREIDAVLGRPDIKKLAAGMRAHLERGGRIAAGCSSVFLLAHAGLLEQRRVTTSWWLAPHLPEIESSCQVEASRMVCEDGPVVTAGAAFAQTDLMLHLLRTQHGAKLAEWVSRFLLLDARMAQSPYVTPEVLALGDELIERIMQVIETALPEVPAVSELAAHFCISERTLARHVRRATGKSPLALIQSVRVRKARQLLEQSKLSVAHVAEAVGYADATALRRLMRKATGANPGRYRPGLHVTPTSTENA